VKEIPLECLGRADNGNSDNGNDNTHLRTPQIAGLVVLGAVTK
jgi:hypothetical protein